MKFKRYSSIENATRSKFIDAVRFELASKGEWAFSEKIHGANFSMWTDGAEIKCAKRSGFLNDTDNFFMSQTIKNRYSDKLMNMYYRLGKPNELVIYGEIFGGGYPHPDVDVIPNVKKIQKGVHYTPDVEFYAFDVMIDGIMQNDDVADTLLEEHYFFHAENLFEGTLQECLDFEHSFQTTIPKRLGLPEIPNNLAEGGVIKPRIATFLSSGERVIIKHKIEKFSEGTTPRTGRKPPPELSPEALVLFDELHNLINENRLRNVISRFGKVMQPDFGRLMKEFTADILDDFNKDHGETFMALEKDLRKRLTKRMSTDAATIIRTNFLNILDETF